MTQFHVTNWSSDGTCSNLKVLTDVIEEVAKVQRRTGNNPILVHCRYCHPNTDNHGSGCQGMARCFNIHRQLPVSKETVISQHKKKLRIKLDAVEASYIWSDTPQLGQKTFKNSSIHTGADI